MSSRAKLYSGLALIGILLLGFITTSVTSYLVAQQASKNHITGETLPLTSDNVYSEIEKNLARSVLISSLMAHDTLLRDWIVGGEKKPKKIERYLGEIQRKYHTTTAFFVSATTHNYYHSRGILKTVDKDDPQDAWYFRTRAAQRPYLINVDTDTADPSRLTVFVNYRVMGASGKLLGIGGIGLSVHSVADLIGRYEKRYSSTIYLVNRNGDVKLHSPNNSNSNQLKQRVGSAHVASRILSNPSTALNYTNADGRVVYLNSRLIPQFNWYLIVQQHESSADNRILNTLLFNIGLALAITILVCLIGWFSTRNYQKNLEQMASTDTLTESVNRRAFELLFNHAVKTARRNGTPMSLLAVDVNRFKAINDDHGHAAGDAVLRTLAEIFRSHLRQSDTLCRWGGDEFIILLADCNLADAGRLADNISESVNALNMRHGSSEFDISVSIGTAERRDGEDLISLATRADEAMYRAKRLERERS